VRFEFLDNSVALGEQPRTVAFGSNDTLNVLDVSRVLDIERFRHVNVDAHSPELLFDNKELLAPMHNTGFLRLCIARIREVNFADQATGRVYLQIVAGAPVWVDPEALAMAAASEDTRAGLLAAAPAVLRGGFSTPAAPRYLRDLPSTGPIHTLGQWGRETT